MIEVGEWIKTEIGLIRRIKSIDKEEATENCPVDMYWCNLDKPIEILKECSKDTIYAIEMSNAEKLKHSKNVIDLIEEGDYVNGKRVFETENRINDNGEKVVLTENYDEWTDDGVIANKDIETILTKEQMEANQYVVK